MSAANELHTVYGNEKINPGQSLLIGLINSLSQEHGLTCVNIDISLNQNSDLATNLVAELNRKYNVQERIISLRGNYRWVYEHQNNLEYTSEKNNTIKNNNTYLITGGLGNMGFLLAKHLITNYDIELILIGRTIINGNNEKNARLQHLRSISNKVNYFSTDISDSAKFEECIKDIEERFGAINGIVHVVGNVDRNNSELVSDITWQKSFNVFSAKIKGIENIYKVFKSRNLDFVWATASLASALGGISFGAYSSANLFMENFIASKTAEIPNWKCIALPVVIFDEQNLKKEKGQRGGEVD